MKQIKKCPFCRSQVVDSECTKTRDASCPYVGKIEQVDEKSKEAAE